MIHNCRKCGAELTDDNWYSSDRERGNYVCKECERERKCLYREANAEKVKEYHRLYQEANRDKLNAQKLSWRINNPDKAKAQQIRAQRKRGQLPMSDNKACSSYFGVYVNERLLKHYFDDVEVMPMNTPGYDLVCNKGKKIDGKASCLRKNGRWEFTIRHNTIADYFMLVAYDNREDLNPLHIWLIPGHVLNHLMGTSISPNTLDKWAEYEQPIDKLSACCDKMKSR